MKGKMKQKICLRYQTNDLSCLKIFVSTVQMFSLRKKVEFSSVTLPTRIKRYTVLRSPHGNKKAKDQFEIRLYNGLIVLETSSFDVFMVEEIKKIIGSNLVVRVSFFFNLGL